MLCPNRVFRQHTGNLPDGPDAAAIQQKLDSVGEKLCATIGRLEELRDKLALLLAAYGNFDMLRTPIILHVSAPCPHTHTHTHPTGRWTYLGLCVYRTRLGARVCPSCVFRPGALAVLNKHAPEADWYTMTTTSFCSVSACTFPPASLPPCSSV